MMKKILATTVLAITLITSGFAQNTAKSVLEKVSNTLRNTNGATADFTYSTTDKNNHNVGTINGTISLKGNKYYIKQGDNEIFCNGKILWNFNGSDEVSITAVDNSNNGTLNPQKLLSGNFVEQDFSSKMISSDGNFYVIELKPVDERKNFTKVNVSVNKAKNLITKATVWEKGGNTISFNMTNVNTNASLPDSKFAFDAKAHPGVEVIN